MPSALWTLVDGNTLKHYSASADAMHCNIKGKKDFVEKNQRNRLNLIKEIENPELTLRIYLFIA